MRRRLGVSDFTKGQVVQLNSLVRRLCAGNETPMTGSGTNTYIVGNDQIAVIDPGPADQEHIDAILATVGDNLRWIVVTHTHPDHSPAAAILAEKTGAELIGSVLMNDGHQDESFSADRNVQHEDVIKAPDFTLRAIHTPGHVSNHFCYLIEEEGMLLTGDHIMEGSTVVIIPPSGDMSDYISSLERLNSYDIQSLGPGHGEVMENPSEVINGLITHRMMREKKVLDVISKVQEGDLNSLTPDVYNDVDKSLHPIAQFSLWAHLLKLEKEGVVAKTSEKHWAFGEEKWRYLS